ncbi:MAG: DUF1292 domain-containing protein [Corallococcus sp.]|nr:DUF1292 domain-containing protein [Corallococcus sp.]MCM1360103.1 DUF1292 domain-containing protein [Corallococcus sp.]MCM1395660.1 DUF1292 domain-containing protein [Corallococcus sp.]
MQEKSVFEILTDENDTENIVLQNEEGEEVEFEQIATIPLGEEVYCILRPLSMEDIAEDEAFVFRLANGKDDEENLELVTDDKLSSKVFDEYYRLCDEDFGK